MAGKRRAPVAPHEQAASEGVLTAVQDGARWLYGRPAGPDVAAWFIENAKLHEGMDAGEWANGLVVIQQTETIKVMLEDGTIADRQRLMFAPFVKAEARVLYWRRWLLLHPEYIGVIERNRVPRVSNGSLVDNSHLPDGYFLHAVPDGNSSWKSFLGCSVNVSVYERDVRSGGPGRLVMQAPGEKVVDQMGRWGPDVNAIMAAQTGATARALGLLGMLVIAGSSVATAEDVQEALAAQGTPPPSKVDVALPAGIPDRDPKPAAPEDQRAYVLAMLSRLQSEHPERHEEVQAWARERQLDWANLQERQLRGVVRQLERKLAEPRPAAEPKPAE